MRAFSYLCGSLIPMKNFERTIRSILAGSLLVLFLGYVGCVTLFYHAHHINGQWIVHSHPYADSPDTGRHTHSSLQFSLISALSTILMLAASFGFLFRLFAIRLASKAVVIINHIPDRRPSVLSLRAPPAFR